MDRPCQRSQSPIGSRSTIGYYWYDPGLARNFFVFARPLQDATLVSNHHPTQLHSDRAIVPKINKRDKRHSQFYTFCTSRQKVALQ